MEIYQMGKTSASGMPLDNGMTDLSSSSWIIPHGDDVTRLSLNVDPRTGKKNQTNTPQSHSSWLEQYAKWLRKNYDLDVDELSETGWSAVQKGWIRKTGERNTLNYTIPANGLNDSIKLILNDIWSTITYQQNRGEDLKRTKVHIDVWTDPSHIQPIGDFSLEDFISSGGNIGSFIRLRRNPNLASSLIGLSEKMDRYGQFDLADKIDDMIHQLSLGPPAPLSVL